MNKKVKKDLKKKVERVKKTSDAYRKNKETGTLVTLFLALIDTVSRDRSSKVKDELVVIEPKIFDKADALQKVIINKYVITKLLHLGAKEELDVTKALYHCDVRFKNNIWLKGLEQEVLPLLLNKHSI